MGRRKAVLMVCIASSSSGVFGSSRSDLYSIGSIVRSPAPERRATVMPGLSLISVFFHFSCMMARQKSGVRSNVQ